MSNWLYQIRIKVSDKLSGDLRGENDLGLSKAIIKIASDNRARLVCTFDAFAEYCEEAEREGIEQYELYHWTKSTIDNPDKKAKHLKSFAFYEGNNQVYSKELASSIEQGLKNLDSGDDIVEISFIDSNPANNPQPPKRVE
ncbi:MAG: hypothetical protein CMD82_06015 [Gammaproteobacteria bacterium]|nr:hypothetical protein [Gammaproteobacteria bacterium]|tara:strand:- start:11532 stop:11954 length:423 start_codon:yes stop_codon:yes gene_type:complete